MTLPLNPKGDLYVGATEYALRCPACGHWGEIDADQANGRVSINHAGDATGRGCACGCTFHETRNWLTTADRYTRDPYGGAGRD